MSRRHIHRSAGPRARRALAGLCLGLACLAGGCDAHEEVIRVPSQREANQVAVALGKDEVIDVRFEQVKDGRSVAYAVLVPRDRLPAAREILDRLGLPRREPAGFDAMLASSGLIPSRSEERARLMHALAGELERTLLTVDRVVDARVHVVIPERDPLASDADPQAAPTATVLIRYLGEGDRQAAQATTDPGADAPIRPEDVKLLVGRTVGAALTAPAPADGKAAPKPAPDVVVVFKSVENPPIAWAQAQPAGGQRPDQRVPAVVLYGGAAAVVTLISLGLFLALKRRPGAA